MRSLPSSCHAVLDPCTHAGLRAEHRVTESAVTSSTRAPELEQEARKPSVHAGLKRAPRGTRAGPACANDAGGAPASTCAKTAASSTPTPPARCCWTRTGAWRRSSLSCRPAFSAACRASSHSHQSPCGICQGSFRRASNPRNIPAACTDSIRVAPVLARSYSGVLESRESAAHRVLRLHLRRAADEERCGCCRIQHLASVGVVIVVLLLLATTTACGDDDGGRGLFGYDDDAPLSIEMVDSSQKGNLRVSQISTRARGAVVCRL